MDVVALVSVCASAALGAGGLWLTARSSGRRLRFDQEENARNRVHERALSHDERIRDDRVRLYVDLLAESNRVLRDVRARYRVGASQAPIKASDKQRDDDELDLLGARVNAFASDSVRNAWFQFTDALRRFHTESGAPVIRIPEEHRAMALEALGLPADTDLAERLEAYYLPIGQTYEHVHNTIRAELTQGALPVEVMHRAGESDEHA